MPDLTKKEIIEVIDHAAKTFSDPPQKIRKAPRRREARPELQRAHQIGHNATEIFNLMVNNGQSPSQETLNTAFQLATEIADRFKDLISAAEAEEEIREAKEAEEKFNAQAAQAEEDAIRRDALETANAELNHPELPADDLIPTAQAVEPAKNGYKISEEGKGDFWLSIEKVVAHVQKHGEKCQRVPMTLEQFQADHAEEE